MAFSSRRLPMKHQGQITSEMMSICSIINEDLTSASIRPLAHQDHSRPLGSPTPFPGLP